MDYQNKNYSNFFLVIIIFTGINCFANSVPKEIPSTCSTKERENYSAKINFLESQKSIADEMTDKMIQQFNKANANVVLLGNVGKDVSEQAFKNPEHFYDNTNHSHKYMHTGLAYKDPVTSEWKVIHLLNEYGPCGKITNKSYISNGKLRNFYTNPHFKMDILYKIPSKALQDKILQTIVDSPNLHNPNYNGIANPQAIGKERINRQNSNQFILNILATAKKDSPDCQSAIRMHEMKEDFKKIGFMQRDMYQAQICANALGYRPSLVVASKLQSFEAAIDPGIVPEITTSDHSLKSKFNSEYPFASAASIFSFLDKIDTTASDYKKAVEKPTELCPKIGCDRTRHEIYLDYLTKQAQSKSNHASAHYSTDINVDANAQ